MDDIVTRLRIVWHPALGLNHERREAADEIERLRAERDEVRRKLCSIECENDTDWLSGPFPMKHSTPQMFARLHGWDCFKEDGNG